MEAEYARYLWFVQQRHRAWVNRMTGQDQPWSGDDLINTRKFTNVFRAIDYGTQFWIKDIAPSAVDLEDLFYQAVLYRLTNLPSGWLAYRDTYGDFPHIDDSPDEVGQRFLAIEKSGVRVHSGAYMSKGYAGIPKSVSHPQDAARITVEVFHNRRGLAQLGMEGRYRTMRYSDGMGPFMSMQVLTDLGYTDMLPQDENEFIICGPGAVRGAAAVFPGQVPEDVVRYTQEEVHKRLPEVHLVLPDGTHRHPSLMDIQNTFCEYSKYLRFVGRPRYRQYQAQHPLEPVTYPRHWYADDSEEN